MAERPHTPGPWEVDIHPDTGEWRVCEREGVVAVLSEARKWEAVSNVVRTKRNADGSGGFLVSASPANWPCAIGDALLIAAAPDLYEALRDILINPRSLSTSEREAAGLAAIAKAEGVRP
ncbi:hypothetical protein ACFPOB_29595 [Bosea eneae]|uniref:Uncharacterized protein n=1 Tax=Bosea eneae TaxID=151454 RepID=A0ABW0IZE7_9HYPH